MALGTANSTHLGGGAVDVSGNVYVADSNNERVQKFTSSGDFITKWGSRGSGDGQFNKPWGLAVDTSGNVYVSEYDGYRVQMFGPGPVYTLTVTTTGGGTTDPPPGSYNYSAEATANVLAIPSGSYVFDHWELDTVDVGAPNPISVTMDQDHSLHAVFVFSPGPAVPEFPGMNISLFASTRAFLAVAYFTLKRKRHAQLPARFL